MAIQTKQISANGSRGHHKFLFSVSEESTNVANNSSLLSFSLWLSPLATGWDWNISSNPIHYTVTINETNYNGNIVSYDGSSNVCLLNKTQTVTHNTDGTKTVNFSFNVTDPTGQSYTCGNASASGSITLTKIARYTSISKFTVDKRNETSVKINWGTADTIDYAWYSKDNGENWIGIDVADDTTGSFNIGSLSPNTKYNFKLRVRRKDSQLTTDSETVAQTTYKIPTQSLNQKTETTIKVNWNIDSTADQIQYSKDNGKTWSTISTVNAMSGNYTILGLTPNTTYNIKTRIRRSGSQTTYDTASLSITTLKIPTQSLNQKTETTIKINWNADTTIDYLWYSKDNGANWNGISISDKTTGTYTISSLSANTKYNIKTRVRRKSTQTTYDTSSLAVTTYDYPYCTNSPNFKIGDKLTLAFYNPLGRSFTFYIIANGTQITNNWTISGTSYSGVDADTSKSQLYATIPNAQSATYQVKVVYGSSTKTRNNGNTFSVRGTEVPTFTNFAYEDSNTTIVNVTGNKSYIVKNLSSLKVIISSANKMVAKNSATAKSYEISCGNRTISVNYGTGDVSGILGTISVYGNTDIFVKAIDSRGLSTTKKITIAIIDYVNIAQKNTFARVNNFENSTILVTKGSFSLVKCGMDNKNSITSVRYRYAKVEATYGSTWSTLTPIVNGENYTCPNVTLDLDNQSSWKIQVEVKDKFKTSVVELTVSEGIPILYINSSKKNVGIGDSNTTGEAYSLKMKGNIYLKSGNAVIDYTVVENW